MGMTLSALIVSVQVEVDYSVRVGQHLPLDTKDMLVEYWSDSSGWDQ